MLPKQLKKDSFKCFFYQLFHLQVSLFERVEISLNCEYQESDFWCQFYSWLIG